MLTLFFSPFGTINRLPFLAGLIFSLFLMLSAAGIMMLPVVGLQRQVITNWTSISTFLIYLIAVIITLTGFWCSLCVHLKRLADLNVTRWLVLIPFIGGMAASPGVPLVLQVLVQVITLLYMGALLFWPSRTTTSTSNT